MKKRLNLLAAATMAISLSTGAAAATKTFVYCSEASPEGFNPSFYTSGTSFDASSVPLYNRLVEFERGGTSLVPGLAESWDVSEDGKTYTFHLRKGVDFHKTKSFSPKREFNADDVLFSINRQLLEDHPYHEVSGQEYKYFGYMDMANIIDSIEKVDDMTVVFHLTKADATFLANMAMDFASIMSSEYADAMMAKGTPEMVDNSPVGTGPFVFNSYQKDSSIRYVANESYWEGKSDIDRLVFSITPDASVRYAKLKKGECHHMPYPNPADIEQMKAESDINVMQSNGLNVGYLAFNTQKPPFDNVLVRKALNMATDKQSILDTVYQGAGEIAKNPIPPTMWSYNEDTVDYDMNIAEAKKLLAEAGYPDGFKTNIWAMPVQRPYNPNAQRMAELMQADWAKVGVEAEIVSYEWGEYLERTKNGEHETAMLGWTGDNGDPDNFLYVLLGCPAAETGGNIAFWCNTEFNDLLEEAKVTADVAKRTELYEESQLIFKEQAPWITVAHSVVFEPMRNEVSGYKMSPFGKHDFYAVTLAD
ncbi:ABC transporter substrate-binding protein [Reinekea thalattae]|uniref:ABC transporter substrate-binding protein n=1 Tax=Reinekea thalattae TaxID=2593301 RepID=A0A5C8Z8N2_9GAMM|nr:ABC transporter substrate-binding protein [Reinekea thalattae]TXR54495.1 ABC transporter substrate-binding protein [Reinekea thalattae]